MNQNVSIPAPCPLAEIRTGQSARLGNTDISTAIAKTVRQGKVELGKTGIAGDEQATKIIHGGPEKAVLHYAAQHYAAWANEMPAHAALFIPGGFGENFVSFGMDESNVCIGDIVSVGSAILQVAQPRQPCFKLNHRFHHPNMSSLVQSTGRGGWYYRVLQTGEIQAGDTIEIVERRYPEWSLDRVQYYLYDSPLDEEALRTLSTLEPLAASMRDVFSKRLALGKVESWSSRLFDQRAIEPLVAI